MTEKINMESYLSDNGSLTYHFKGTSMLPLLRQGKDLVTIAKKTKHRCKRGDVALYRVRSGTYALHRVVEVRPDSYVIIGDNCINREYGITDNDVIGIMSGFSRGSKEHSVNEPLYKIYTSLWLTIERPRVFIKKLLLRIKKYVKFIYEK